MVANSNLVKLNSKLEQDGLTINRRRKKIQAKLSAFQFIDKDTSQYVIVVPSLEISGYGETLEKAEEMLKFSLDQFAIYILAMDSDGISKEFSSLGWKRNPFRNKEFSKAFIDGNGELQNFNAEGEIKQMTLVAQ